jgi:hypothetical protein
MLRIVRKHNKWLMVAFGILLMIAFTAPELIQRIGHAAADRGIATLNGQKIRLSDHAKASAELMALEQFAPALLAGIGIESRDATHWILLVHEAEAAGLVGGPADGRDFLFDVAQYSAEIRLRFLRETDFQEWFRIVMEQEGEMEQRQHAAIVSMARQYEEIAPRIFAGAHMNQQQMHESLARLRGVLRLVMMHNQAARFSDRHAIVAAKRLQDSAVVDYVFISAADLADRMPEPTPEELEAHFEEFKDTPPGEGDYGIGYLLPPRVKLEWLKIDRAAVEQAVKLDPVEVSKRYMQLRLRYPGEFSEERAAVEADMRREQVDRILQNAHAAINAEVLRATRRLDQDGPFRLLPPDWEQIRPRAEGLAQSVVEAVAREGPRIPLPQVEVRDDRWLTEEALSQLEIGQTFVQRGERRFPAAQVIFSAREFGGPVGIVPVQAGVPFVDNFLRDWAGNRYYLTIVEVREQSPPDSVEEIREQAVRDYRLLAAYRQLQNMAGDLERLARSEGLQAVMAAAPGPEAPTIATNVRVFRNWVDGGDPNLTDQAAREAIVNAAARIDPFTPPEEISPEDGTLAVASDRALGLAIVQIRAKAPLTLEEFRRTDLAIVNHAQQRELSEVSEADNPFSVTALLRRHNYMSGEMRIRTAEELREADEREWEFEG